MLLLHSVDDKFVDMRSLLICYCWIVCMFLLSPSCNLYVINFLNVCLLLLLTIEKLTNKYKTKPKTTTIIYNCKHLKILFIYRCSRDENCEKLIVNIFSLKFSVRIPQEQQQQNLAAPETKSSRWEYFVENPNKFSFYFCFAIDLLSRVYTIFD